MASNKTLIIDCQVLQTNAWDRGMGKYSLSLIATMHKQKVLKGETVLMLNKNLPASSEMLKALKAACPNASITYLDLAVPSSNLKNIQLETANKQVIDTYIDSLENQSDVDFLVLSLFLDQVFIVFPSKARKLLLFYDLIPFLFEKRYAARINYEDYLIRFRTIFEADLIYTISQTVADDLAVYLGIPHTRLKNINGASIGRTHLTSVKPDFEVPKKYILMNSGDELRKNNLNAVKGFAEFNERHGNEFSLIITSFFSETTKKELQIYSDHTVFSGNVSEAQLKWLYDKAEFIFFPSEYEGLGLPILEAMEANKRVACSSIPVFREISNDAFYYFDPADFVSIADGLEQALQASDWPAKKANYPDLLARYTWEETVKSYEAGYREAFGQVAQSKINNGHSKPKIAIFTPHPSGYSAIGKVVAESHAALSEQYDVDYFFDSQEATHAHVRPDFLSYVASCYSAADFTMKHYQDYDAVIYNIGNSDYHLHTIKNALYLPGYVILHDTNLRGAFGELTRLGWITKERFQLEEMLNSKNSAKTSSFLTSLLNNQLGVIAHSKYAKLAAEKVVTDGNVTVRQANLPLEAPLLIREIDSADKLQIGLAGILAEIKGLPLIEKLAGDPRLQNCQFKVFGFSFIKPETLNRLELFDNIRIFRDPSDFEFQTHLSNLDAVINYRSEYNGETSLTVLESMRYGVIPLVQKVGWYNELPEGAVIKANHEDDLPIMLADLSINRVGRKRLRNAARAYVADHHSHQQYVNSLRDLIEQATNIGSNFERAKKLHTAKRRDQLT